MDNNLSGCINKIYSDCRFWNKEICLIADDTVELNGLHCAGFYLEDKLVIAAHRDDWWLTLFHEYCHLCQDIETKFFNSEDYQIAAKFDDWINYEIELIEKDLLKCIRVIQKSELDCEKRVVKLLKEYKIAIDIEDYIRKSNAYVLMYEVVRKHRKWNSEGSPTAFEEIYGTCSDKFIKIKDLGKLPKNFEKYIIKYCF